MKPRNIRRWITTGVTLVTAFASLPAAAGAVEPSSSGQAVGDAVVAALVAAAGTVATADDSATTGCMAADPQPVAYRNDRIVLSTSLSGPVAASKVRLALQSLGSPATITGVETISMQDLPGAHEVPPVISVSFRVTSGEPAPIVRLARHLRQNEGLISSPDYLLAPSTSGPTEFWPSGPPKPTTTPAPTRAPGLGAAATIFVYDGGLPPAGASNNPPNITTLTQADVETLDARAPFGVVDVPSAGHTTAIAGVIAAVAPAAIVEAARITEPSGVATDVTAARRMANTLRHANSIPAMPALIVNAFGSPACDVGPPGGAQMEPLGLQMVAEAVRRNDQALIVASAGNRSTDRRYYPAAFPSVVSVGAMNTAAARAGDAWTSASRSGPKAGFSNWGDWVDAWASGDGLATTHITGYRFDPAGPLIEGLAVVSGTSFAAPMVAALIAEQMAATGAKAKVAWDAILLSGTECSPAIGGGVAVSLTSLQSSATTPAPAAATSEC